MTQSSMPNPIELYEGARDYMIPIIHGVKPAQLSDTTPCTEWNVQQLINHNILVTQFVHGILTGGTPVNPMEVSGPLLAEGAEDAFRAGSDKVLAAIKASGMLEKMLDETPFGPMTAGQLIMLPFGDIVIHKWDLAKATSQDTVMDSSMADVCFQVFAPMAEHGRQGGIFGPEVMVPIDASSRDKLLGLTGRTP